VFFYGPFYLSTTNQILVLLDRVLSRDYRVTVARGGDRAIYCLDRETFDLAILDVRMYPRWMALSF